MIQSIVNFIQQNPFAVLIIALLGFASTIISLIQGYQQYVRGVRVPLWTLIVIAVVFSFALISYSKDDELQTIRGVNFGTETISLDGKRFINCSFEGTRFIIRGEGKIEWDNCRIGKITFGVQGPAERTLQTFTDMYEIPEFRPTLDATFENIKKNSHPRGYSSTPIQ